MNKSGHSGHSRAKVGIVHFLDDNSLYSNKLVKVGTELARESAKKRENLFLQYLEEESLRGHTKKGMQLLKSKVPKLIDYLSEHDIRLNEVRVKEAYAYQGWLMETGTKAGRKYSKSTVLTFIKSASSFYEFLKRKGIVYSNPFKEIKRIREDKKLPRNILKEKELDKLLDELSSWDKEQGLKNRITMYKVHVISELMYASGLRIGEIADLRVGDIDFNKGIINVVHGKGEISRTAYMNDYVKSILKIYIDKLRNLIFTEWHKQHNHLLFKTNWQSLEKLVNKTLKRTADKLNLGKFTSHGFRHALGFHLLRAGCNIRHIQEILGHKCLKNTEVYTKVDREDLKDVFDTFHPRKMNEVKE